MGKSHMLLDGECERHLHMEVCSEMGQSNCRGSLLSRVPNVGYVIYCHIHSLGEGRASFLFFVGLIAFGIYIRNGLNKWTCLQFWGRIWWSEQLLPEVGQSPSFGRVWGEAQGDSWRGSKLLHLVVLTILWSVWNI